MPNESQVARWPGRTVFDADGAKVGKIEDVFADDRTGRPAWATVSSGLFGHRHHFVPIHRAREVEEGVAIPIDGRLVKDAPNVDHDADLSLEDEHALYRHYGLDHDDADRGDRTEAPRSPAPPPPEAPAPERDDEHAAPSDRRAAVPTGYQHLDERTHRTDAADEGARDDDVQHGEARGDGDRYDEARQDDRGRLDEARQDDRGRHDDEPAPPMHDLHVLDRELAQEDLSAPPGTSDSRDAASSDQSSPAPSARVDPPSSDQEATFVPRGGVATGASRSDAGDHDRPGTGTRLRRLVRNLTSDRNDHHG